MDAEALREIQAPLKERYRASPDAALITLRAEGGTADGVACRVDTGRAIIEAGLHPSTGGNGLQACSGDMLLQALVACAGVTISAVATALGLDIRGATLSAEGDLDVRGTLGVDREAPVGFRDIRLTIDVDGELSDDERASLLKLTERYCVVLQTIARGVPVAAELR